MAVFVSCSSRVHGTHGLLTKHTSEINQIVTQLKFVIEGDLQYPMKLNSS